MKSLLVALLSMVAVSPSVFAADDCGVQRYGAYVAEPQLFQVFAVRLCTTVPAAPHGIAVSLFFDDNTASEFVITVLYRDRNGALGMSGRVVERIRAGSFFTPAVVDIPPDATLVSLVVAAVVMDDDSMRVIVPVAS